MASSKCTVVIVNGAPGTGKTHLSRRLAKELRLPLLSKDDIKEGLFEGLGYSDREWSKKLGGASYESFFILFERQLEAGVSCIVETAFIPQFNTPRFLTLKQTYDYHPFQIYCHTEPTILAERFNRRMHTGERHPGHGDSDVTIEAIKAEWHNKKYGALDLGGDLIELDTTDFRAIDFDGLIGVIRTAL
ncbi:ATP-binding protein [Chloroflexi bacterium TSY]|nr:ATP-binding protein [Chloroflexi bacterium TSY]